jgi:hypothetical protein
MGGSTIPFIPRATTSTPNKERLRSLPGNIPQTNSPRQRDTQFLKSRSQKPPQSKLKEGFKKTFFPIQRLFLFSSPIPDPKDAAVEAVPFVTFWLRDGESVQLEELSLEIGEDMDSSAKCIVHAMRPNDDKPSDKQTWIQLDLRLQTTDMDSRFTQVIFHVRLYNGKYNAPG